MVKLSSGIVLNPNELTSEDREAIVKALADTSVGLWKPEKNKVFYHFDDFMNIHADAWHGHNANTHQLEAGNVFPTKEAAEKHLTYLKALQVLRGDTKGYEWKYGDDFHTVYYHESLQTTDGEASYGEPVKFKSRNDAESSIANHEKEWRIVLLGVE